MTRLEPPFIVFCNPYGGLGLKTKTAEAARRRIDNLLVTCAMGASINSIELRVIEPCQSSLADACKQGRLALNLIYNSLAEHGHVCQPWVVEAWTPFGPPNAAAIRQRDGATSIEWSWKIERDPERATIAYNRFCDYMVRHQQLMFDDYSTSISVQAVWSFRLRTAAGTIVAPPYPESSITASLAGRHASAFFDLIFPYAAATSSFIADYQAVCDALGMKLPPRSFRLDALTVDGKKRRRTKLITFT